MKRITSFQDKYRFLSNFYPMVVYLNGVPYRTVEHAYQAAKTMVASERDAIRRCSTPRQAKRMGRKVTMRSDWELVKLLVMTYLVNQKFKTGELGQWLKDTGDAELIEGNTWGDKFWGAVRNGERWVGENHLGKILMQVRKELR